MQRTLRTGALLAGALTLTLGATAQEPMSHASMKKVHVTSTDVAATFSFEHEQVAQMNGNSFWLKGGSLDGSVTFFRGLGIAANFTGEHATNVANGVNFGKVAFMAGPRYTFDASHYTKRFTKKHKTALFGEWLFGGAHGFDSIFPGQSGTTTSAGAFSTQLGGGADLWLAKGFGVRALELDYVHTNFPNNAANTQNDFRLAFGVSYRK